MNKQQYLKKCHEHIEENNLDFDTQVRHLSINSTKCNIKFIIPHSHSGAGYTTRNSPQTTLNTIVGLIHAINAFN